MDHPVYRHTKKKHFEIFNTKRKEGAVVILDIQAISSGQLWIYIIETILI